MPETLHSAEPATRAGSQPRLALIVEDAPEFQALIVDAMSELAGEWETRCVQTGKDALDLFDTEDFAPDLILVDMGLPDMNGVEVIRQAHACFAEAPILVISVIASHDSVVKAIRAGAKGYVQKGDSTISIAYAIGRVLEGDYPISPSLARHLFNLVREEHSRDPLDIQTPLTATELDVLCSLGQGLTYQEVAEKNHVAVSTVQFHVKNIYAKLDVNSRARAATKARAEGWI